MNDLAGTGILLRLAVRRDRIRLPVWVAAIVGFGAYCVVGLETAYPTEKDLGALVSFVQGPAGTLLTGPGYGLDQPTRASVFAAVYMLYLLVATAFMNVLLVVRHTRADEESGRAELVRSGVVGRHSGLAAAVLLAALADLVLGALVAAMLTGSFGASGSVLLGAAVAAVGIAFAGFATVAVQVSESARAATGIGVTTIGLAVVVRGVGDVLGEHGSALSWVSPFAWAQQTRVFVEPRTWPLLLCVVLALLGCGVGATLQSRRDVGAGLRATRPGRAGATPRLGSVWGLALRLERPAIIAWTAGVGVTGALYGSLAASVRTSFADLPDDLLVVLGGDRSQLLDGFVSVMVLLDALLAACCGIALVHRLAGEERSSRAEVVLATATGRVRWMGAGLVASAVGVLGVLVVSGLGMGVAAAAVLGDGSRVGQVLAAHLAYLPAVAVVVALAGLGFAWGTRWIGAAWVVVAFCVFVGFFGPLVDVPTLVTDASPFSHVARLPLESWAPWPLVTLAALAAATVVVSLRVFGRRDLSAG